MRSMLHHPYTIQPIAVLCMLIITCLLTSCAEPITSATVRATAVTTGCWPYGQYQAPTPRVPTVNPTAIVLGTPTATRAPTVVAYPTCVPLATTPTVTPTPIPPATPQPHDMHIGLAEIGATNGKNTTYAVAIDTLHGVATVGWVNWGSDPTKTTDGMVWVRSQQPDGTWGDAQTLNTTDNAVNGMVGGFALTAPTTRTVVAAWGDGSSTLFSAESTDSGATWSAPVTIGSWAYQVIDLKSDLQGGVHLLALTDGPHHLVYSYRAPGSTTWTAPSSVGSGPHYQGAFAVLDLPDGHIRRFAAFTSDVAPNLFLARSDDGTTWTNIPVQTGRYMTEAAPIAPALVAAQRPDGTAVVTLAWCQYSKSGVFAQVSTDGGLHWGSEEPVFHNIIDGYWPSLAYDRATDTVAMVVTELKRHHIPPHRVRLAGRPLTGAVEWRFKAVDETFDGADDSDDANDNSTGAALDGGDTDATAEPTSAALMPEAGGSTAETTTEPAPTDDAAAMTGTNIAPILAAWGWRGKLFGDVRGDHAWLVSQDERNGQDRIYAQPLQLPALFAEGVS